MIYMLHRDSWISKIYQGLQSKYLKHFERFWESPKYSNVVWNPIKVFENIVLNALPNPEKSRDLVFKNPVIGIWVQSLDPGISQDPGIGLKSRSRDFWKLNPGIFRDLVKHSRQCFRRPLLGFRQHLSILGTPRTFQSASNIYSEEPGRF